MNIKSFLFLELSLLEISIYFRGRVKKERKKRRENVEKTLQE